MRERKIIQIAAAVVPETASAQSEALVFALADDGTLWEAGNREASWRQWPALPQHPSEADDCPPLALWIAGEELPDCPGHDSPIEPGDCQICNCLWLLKKGLGDDPDATACDLEGLLAERGQDAEANR